LTKKSQEIFICTVYDLASNFNCWGPGSCIWL